MNKVKKWLKVILGCCIVGLSINIFFINYKLIPSGMLGFAVLYASKTVCPLWFAIFLVNLLFILIGFITISKETIKKALVPCILIPTFVFLSTSIASLINLSNADLFLVSIYGGVCIGLGYRLIYKEGHLANSSDIVKNIASEVTGRNSAFIPYLLDILWIIFSFIEFGIISGMYSVIAVIIIETISHRANLGIGDSKVFYIITKKEKEVKEYIMNELNYDVTEFEVKGGFSKNKNKVIMTVIPTKDYYRLREGIKFLDSRAFISITDSYEVINANNNCDN